MKKAFRSCAGILAVLLWVLLLCSIPAMTAEDEVIGTVRELLKGNVGLGSTLSGTPLGCAVADAMRAAADTDMAIACGGDIIHNLEAGEVSLSDVRDVFSQDRPICSVTVTVPELKALLEAAVAGIVVGDGDAIDTALSQSDGFPQPSGFSYTCDCSALPGLRITEVTREDRSLDLTDDSQTFTLALTDAMAAGAYGGPILSAEDTGQTLVSSLADAVGAGILQTSYKERAAVIGSTDNSILSMIPVGMLLFMGLIFAEYRYRKNTKQDQTRYNYRNDRGYSRPDHYKN